MIVDCLNRDNIFYSVNTDLVPNIVPVSKSSNIPNKLPGEKPPSPSFPYFVIILFGLVFGTLQ